MWDLFKRKILEQVVKTDVRSSAAAEKSDEGTALKI